MFNSIISTIKSDLSTLMHYATIGFDGLPASLQHVLNSIQNNKMPSQWRLALPSDSGSASTNLNEGLEGTKYEKIIRCSMLHHIVSRFRTQFQ